MTEEVKHTPGPWVHEGHLIYGPEHVLSKHPNGRVLIAEVIEGSYRADPHLDGGADRFDFCSKADVRLIANAPELLYALGVITGVLDDVVNGNGVIGGEDMALEVARTALAHARGETP